MRALYVMKTEEALVFLKEHQPMPADVDIAQSQCDCFCGVLEHFRNDPDERCIPLLINCVSNSTGLGMYETIGDVLVKQNREKVVLNLTAGLTNGSDAVKYRCCWWATDIDAWDLEDLVWPLTKSQDEDLSEAAAYYFRLKHENV